jgi:FkbM family methyltransferase
MPSYYERIAHAVIGSSLQAPLEALRDTRNRLTVLRHPGLKNIYEEDRQIKKLFSHQIKDGMNCVDIGAHLGVILEEFERRSPSGKNVAFEALAYKSDWLKKKYPNAAIHCIALSETAGEVTFHYNKSQSGFSGLKAHTLDSKNEDVMCLTVPSAPLSDVLPDDYHLDFIKIDVEGAELIVLRSGLDRIQRDRPPILFECCRDSLELFGSTADEVYGFFDQLINYDIYVIRDFIEGGRPLGGDEFQQAMIYPFRAFNFFAVPR